jgi:hypothetical protein
MARQASFLKLDGRIGDVSFYQTSTDGFLAREKGGVSAERIRTDPRFARTRENGAEFGNANEAARLLRTALRGLILGASDSRMSSRLSSKMVEVVKADATSTRGKRNVIDGETELLQGFEFNAQGLLGQTLYAPYTTTVDRATGNLAVSLPAFIPANMIAAPTGATHARLISAATAVDFEGKTYVVTIAQSADIVLGPQQQPVVNLAHALGPNNTHPIFLVLGIEFHQQVNGAMYPLKNGAFNALAIVAVDQGV